jgi:phosphoribosylaminoimidazole carboxylase
LDAEKSPAKQVNAHEDHVTGAFNKADDIRRLAEKCDVLTIEIEHVDTRVLKELSGVSVQPSGETISLIQDKYAQKEHLISKEIEVAKSLPIDAKSKDEEANEVASVAEQLGGYPVMLKARKDAYDGRGNFALKNAEQIPEALKELGNRALYAEQWANFTMELAVMVVKTKEEAGGDWQQTTLAYPTVETIHEESICKLVYAPPRGVDAKTSQRAQEMARRAIAQFAGKGIFGVEMFLLQDGMWY